MTETEAMQLKQELHDGVLSITLHGRLDATSGDRTRGALVEGAASHPRMLLDCSGVTFLSSAGLHAIVIGHRSARDHGVKFAVVLPTSPAAETVKISGIDKVIPIFGSRAAALESMK